MNRGYGNISKEEVLIIGELIHLRMQRHPLLIKDRRQQLRTHPCCFIGREVVEWLIKNGEALNEQDAIACMRLLQAEGVIHHVTDEHLFKCENLFYRFRIDDGTFFVDTDYEAYHQAIMIHQRILGDSENTIMMNNSAHTDKMYENSFSGCNFVNWLASNDIARDRYAAVMLAQHLLDLLLIKAVANDEREFYDNDTAYRFIFDVDFPFPLYQVLYVGDLNDSLPTLTPPEKTFSRLSLQDMNKTLLSKFWKGVWQKFDKDKASAQLSSYTLDDEGTIPTLKPVVLREVTVEELTSKESPYYSKNITIEKDSVDFGFIIRGNGPCYVQAVDPTSPAADAGLKVRMYLYSVNGKVVLNMPYQDVGKEIVKFDVVDLVVLQNLRSSS